MKTGKIFGQMIKINEKDFKQILNRFDIEKFKEADKGWYKFKNYIKCPLCKKYLSTDCRKCEFYKFHGSHGCIWVLDQISSERFNYVSIKCDYITSDKKGFKYISKIRNYLIKHFK
jgi:hypothetical protein